MTKYKYSRKERSLVIQGVIDYMERHPRSIPAMLKRLHFISQDLLATTTKSSKECGTGCSENTLLEAKMNTKFSKSSKEKEYECPICKKIAGSKVQLECHLDIIHSTPSTNIKEIEPLGLKRFDYSEEMTMLAEKINETVYSLNTIIKK